MAESSRILPGQPVPEMKLSTLDGDTFDIGGARPRTFTLIVVYRGLHCPICKEQLTQLRRIVDDFTDRGVDVVAVSMDDEQRARQSQEEWNLTPLRIGYGLAEDTAREWGLFISQSIKDGEPKRFCEPGMFLVRPDGTLYAAFVQSTPFARPKWGDILDAIDFVEEKDYPPRGTVQAQETRSAA